MNQGKQILTKERELLSINGIEDFISAWSQKPRIAEAVLLEWKRRLMKLINNRIIGTEISLTKTKFIKNGLQHIHDQFEVAPIDKANENVAFICKRFHVEVLIKKVSF